MVVRAPFPASPRTVDDVVRAELTSADLWTRPPSPPRSPSPRRRPPRVRWRPVLASVGVFVLWLAWVALPERATDQAADAMVAVVGPDPLPTSTIAAPVLRTATPVPTSEAPGAAAAAESAAGVMGDATEAPSSPAQQPTPQPTTAPTPQPTAVPEAGTGSFVVAGGGTEPVGSGATAVRYSVEVEDGVPFDPSQVAGEVDAILSDERSWTSLGRWTVQRVDAGPDARILLASPDTTDRLCAPLRTSGIFSCRQGDLVVLNAARWAGGADSWGEDVVGYRSYLVNHEVGHYLGFGHVGCPAAGAPAPVMMQQTKTVASCVPNAWPAVTGG